MKHSFAPSIFFAAIVISLIAAPVHAAPKALAPAAAVARPAIPAIPASPAPAAAVARPASPAGAASGDQGMVIKGDQEAPLVLYIVPWQEPKVQVLPEAPLQALLPVVLDSDRSLVDDPINRTLGARDGAKGK